MKFAKELGAHITPEWRKQYMDYERMKTMLTNYIQSLPDDEMAASVETSKTAFKESWFQCSDAELAKVTQFYTKEEAEAKNKFTSLKGDLDRFTNREEETGYMNIFTRQRKSVTELKEAYASFYLSLVLLQNFVKYNLLGFKKIMKKFDKNMKLKDGAKWVEEKVNNNCKMATSKEIDKLIVQVENLVTTELEKGNRKKAMSRLKVPPIGFQESAWTTIKVGFFVGCFFILLVAIICTILVMNHSRKVPTDRELDEMRASNGTLRHLYRSDWKVVTRLYRGPLLCIIMMILLGINVHGWGRAGVNHVLIFELDPRDHSSFMQVIEVAAGLGLIWAISLLSFLFSDYLGLPALISPLSLVTVLTLFLLNPIKVFKYNARKWMVSVFIKVVLTPLFYTCFADFWVADQFNSIAPVFADLHYFICFYNSKREHWDIATEHDGDVCLEPSFLKTCIVSLPALWRFVQCLRRYRDTRHVFPHLVNAGKYSTTLISNVFSYLTSVLVNVVASKVMFSFWIITKTISSFYALIWDLKMDWGFFSQDAGENKFLREDLVYDNHIVYYLAIAEDIVLRLLWIVGLVLKKTTSIPPELISSVLNFCEVFRRFVWNFFRLENEHLNNCGQFRVVRDISIAPVNMKDQEEIIMMMDTLDGAQQVRKRRKELG